MYVQYDIRYTHCHFCISTVDLNGSPSNSNPSKHTQVPSVEFIHIYWSNITAFTQGFPLHLPCRAHGPSSHWAAFQSHWPAGKRQTASRWESARCETPATTSWRGKNWSFGAWKSHLIYLYVDLSLSKFIYIDVGFFASTIECYWDLLSIFGRVMRRSLIRVWNIWWGTSDRIEPWKSFTRPPRVFHSS